MFRVSSWVGNHKADVPSKFKIAIKPLRLENFSRWPGERYNELHKSFAETSSIPTSSGDGEEIENLRNFISEKSALDAKVKKPLTRITSMCRTASSSSPRISVTNYFTSLARLVQIKQTQKRRTTIRSNETISFGAV
jgi:hypothetical protein